MEAYEKNLGRTAVSCGDEHDNRNEYPEACIVYKIIDTIINSFISKKAVPKNIELTNKEYWQPISLTIQYI